MTDFFNEENVKIKEEITSQIPDHQVLLSFRDDIHGEAFCDWWEANGKREFKKWCDEFEGFMKNPEKKDAEGL
jgi:hypothetical protein